MKKTAIPDILKMLDQMPLRCSVPVVKAIYHHCISIAPMESYLPIALLMCVNYGSVLGKQEIRAKKAMKT